MIKALNWFARIPFYLILILIYNKPIFCRIKYLTSRYNNLINFILYNCYYLISFFYKALLINNLCSLIIFFLTCTSI